MRRAAGGVRAGRDRHRGRAARGQPSEGHGWTEGLMRQEGVAGRRCPEKGLLRCAVVAKSGWPGAGNGVPGERAERGE